MAIDISFDTPLNVDLNMYHCGTEECSPLHSYGPSVRDHFLIHYIHRGKGYFRIGNKVYNLEAGQGFLICPNIVTIYQADNKEPWSYSWVGFQGLKAESYLKKANLTFDNPIFRYDHDRALIKCFDDMSSAKSLAKSADIRLLSLLYQFFSILIENTANINTIESISNKKQVSFYCRYIKIRRL